MPALLLSIGTGPPVWRVLTEIMDRKECCKMEALYTIGYLLRILNPFLITVINVFPQNSCKTGYILLEWMALRKDTH